MLSAKTSKVPADGREDVLDEIVHFLAQTRIAPEPAANKWCVESDEALPGIAVIPVGQALKQADGRFCHGPLSVSDLEAMVTQPSATYKHLAIGSELYATPRPVNSPVPVPNPRIKGTRA
jgi:hypothetical protein